MLTGETPQTGQYRERTGAHAHRRPRSSPAPRSTICGRRCSPSGSWIRPDNGTSRASIRPTRRPTPWTLQPTHPELIEALATEFINSNYSMKHMIRLMANSQAYQLSSQYHGNLASGLRSVFRAAHHAPAPGGRGLRRGGAGHHDRHADGHWKATPRRSTMPANLPDTTEPRNDGTIFNFLNNFGRGDWWNNPRNSSSTIVQALFMMNDNSVNFRDLHRNRSTRVQSGF